MSRLTIDMSEAQHRSLKALAALQGQSIRQYALDRLFPEQDDARWDELTAMLRERIADGLAGKVSDRTFDAIVDDEMRRTESAG
jgi:isopropylmalate/homocitrate/citramalate synthase